MYVTYIMLVYFSTKENFCNEIFYIFTTYILNAYFGWILHGLLRKAALAQTGGEALYDCVPAGRKHRHISITCGSLKVTFE